MRQSEEKTEFRLVAILCRRHGGGRLVIDEGMKGELEGSRVGRGSEAKECDSG